MGLATAKLLADRGATLSLADINEEALKKAKDSLSGDKHIYQVVDVSKSDSVDAWIQKTVDTFGKLHGAVNMAGIIAEPVPLTEYSDEVWDKMFAVNTRGVFNCLRAELRAMSAGASIVSSKISVNCFITHCPSGICCKCLRPIWRSRTCRILRKQSSCYRPFAYSCEGKCPHTS